VNNVPYASLTAVMTSDPDERTSIASYRQIAANSAGFIVSSLAIPMVRYFGHGNDALGYQLTMGLLSALSVIFFIVASSPPKNASSLTLSRSLRSPPISRTCSRTDPGFCFFWSRSSTSRL